MEFRGLPQAPSAPVSFHVASLLESFSIIPSAAAPAILDCILASSSLSSSALFSSLLEAIPAVVQPPQSNYILSYMTSLCHLIGKTGSQYDSMSQFIWRVFLPLLKASPDESELLSQMDALFCEVVSKIQPWELMGVTLVPFCLRSLRFSLGICESEDLATYQWKVDNIDQDYNSIPLGALPLQSGCRVLKSLLLSAMRCKEMLVLGQSSAEEEDILVCFINNLTWDLSRLVLGVHMQSSEHRSSAVRILLPVIIRCLNELSPVSVCVQGSLCRLSRVSFSKELWNCCSTLFGLGHLERLDALSILSIYFSIFFDNDKFDNQSIENTKLFVAIERKEFWEEIRKGLVDNDSAMRKQALYILKILLKHYSLVEIHDAGCFSGDSRMRLEDDKNNLDDIAMSVGATKRERWADREARSLGVGEVYHTMDQFLNSYGRWKVFILLYEMLEEYGTHLVEAAWSHQVSLLFQSSLPDSSSLSCESYISQMENPVARFTWLAVLWERGFSHENPQVRCLILASFLCMDWGNLGNSIHLIPKAFVLGSLTRALNDVSHHNDFGVKGVYTSKTIERASKFYHEFSHNLTLSESASFISSLALVATSNSFGRAGLMALASCIASAACCCDTHPANEECSATEEVKSTEERCLPFDAAELLDALGIVIERSKQHFNPNYRRRVCEDVLNAASSLTNVMDIEFDLLLHFIAKVPREFTDNGSLRVIVQKWFLKCNYSRMYVLENLIDFPMSFIVQMQLSESSTSFDDDDVESWGREAQRWARVLFLVLTEAKHLEAIFMCLEKYSSSLCNQNSCREWVPIKLFILFLALIEELQIGFSSVVHLSVDKYRTEYNIINQLGRETLPEISIYYKTAGAFHHLLEHLVPFTKLASSVFWSVPAAEDLQLPPSIKGRLGGPSQRRLASVITSRVLQAIFSLRTVASISSWCNELESGDFSDTFSFLWTFSWKAVQSSIYHTEVGAEISLAMYEALAYVLKVFPNNFTKLNLDFVLSYNETQWSDREAIHLLDPLVLNFLDNMKKLLANGLLTRSRRAVLMNWKWICLASLLSIPSNVMAYSHISSAVSLLSHSTLRSVFLDIVDSLENAGENSLLPMLKSVRLVLGLLCSSATLSSIHQCEVTDEMMQLAQSSWILHVNCNKRRVAPIAALLSSVLHQSLFSHLAMHDSKDNKPGPLKWFVGKLLDDGKRSPRTIRLAALHLTGLWLLYPATIKYYIKELKLLTLYGSVAFDEDFEAELSENHEAEIEVSILAQSPDQEFTEVFINTEMYARASVAALFYKLANFTLEDGEREKNDAISSGKFFLLEMLDSVVNEQDLAKELYKKYSGVHRRKVRAWQMICILSHFVEDDIVGKVTSDLHICLHRNNLPAVRQYLEIFAIQIYLKFPSLAEEQLIPIFHNYNLRPQALSSYVFIAANVIRHESDLVVQRIHLNELFPAIIPLLTSHHHSLRGFTQLLVYHVLCKLWPIMINNGSEVASLAEKCFGDLRLYLAENTDCVKLRVSMEGLLNAFDPKLSATPSGVFDVQKEGSEFECVPISLMEKVMDFLNGVREDLRFSMAKDAMIIKNEHFDATNMWKDMAELPDGSSKEPQAMLKDINLDFQRKITLQKEVRPSIDHDSIAMASDVEFPRLLSDLEKEDQLFGSVLQVRNQALERIRQQKQQFILVASLIDRIPNLAGLARTCEIFKAAGLVFADASILQDKQFQLISVTAEKWVPIIEVPISNIKGFLEKKRKEGFSILGLEQTANSTRLDQYSFPTKTVLVLGREKEGIPVDIIHVLDGCVEIPQLGIIRSLNVHVSGAIALWEYTRQQRHKL